MARMKPRIRYDRIIGAVILFLLFIIVLIWIFGDGKKDDLPHKEDSKSEPTSEPSHIVFLSPSNQTDNVYAAGDTTEAEAMRNLSERVKGNLESVGNLVYEAQAGTILKEKTAEAGEIKADAYVAIHSAASDGEETSGTRCFYNPNIKGSKQLAEYVYDKVAALTPTEDLGVVDGTDPSNYLYELDKANTVICFIDVEFHDNEEQAQWILDNTDALAKAIANGVTEYLDYADSLPTEARVGGAEVGKQT